MKKFLTVAVIAVSVMLAGACSTTGTGVASGAGGATVDRSDARAVADAAIRALVTGDGQTLCSFYSPIFRDGRQKDGQCEKRDLGPVTSVTLVATCTSVTDPTSEHFAYSIAPDLPIGDEGEPASVYTFSMLIPDGETEYDLILAQPHSTIDNVIEDPFEMCGRGGTWNRTDLPVAVR